MTPFDNIPRPGLWKKLLLGTVLVIFASAGATGVAAFHEIDKVVEALELSPALKLDKRELAETDPGDPQTLMILGSDHRPKNNVEGAGGARSDTIMLVRLAPDKKAIAVLSLPRDLKVEIPGYGTDKLNAAYEAGGPELTLKTVNQLTGLPINHVINVDFSGFWRAVNAVGCVYADIDRTYYNASGEYSYCARARRAGALSTTRSESLLSDGESTASALTGGYHLAFAIGAGLLLVAIAVAVTVLQPETQAAEEVEAETARGEPAYSEAA